MSATRYRCRACGNLTRFDVTTARRTRAFHHYSVGGELDIEDTEVLSETIESVVCRWCGPSATVDELTDEDLAETGAARGADAATEPAVEEVPGGAPR